tara:strand:+ start:251 stop:994 length:744 start_codon:yes stop_codon:yes gene_type:complete
MNKSLTELLRKRVAEAQDERWKEVEERHIFLKKLQKKKEKEVKIKLKLFYDNLQYKNNKYKIAKTFSKSKNICYVYFLINYDEIVYIGKSINYEARITAHGFEYNLIRVIKTNEELGEKWETKLIKKYQPIHNKDGISTFKVDLETRKTCYTGMSKVRKYDPIKPQLNLKFKETHIKKKYYTYKDARSVFYSFEDTVNRFKQYKVKFWSYQNKRIRFYTFKPNDVKYLYPITKKPIDIENERISNTN